MTEQICQLCDRTAMKGRGLCWSCGKGIGRDRGNCARCGKPNRLLDHDDCCRWCRELARKRCQDCGPCDVPLVGVDGSRVCNACALRRDLDRVLAGDGVLAPLRESILAAEPLTTRRWLARTRELLQDLDTGRIPLSHDTLDQFPQRRAAEHLRALLVATRLLAPDPHRSLRRLETRVPDLLTSLDLEHRRITTRWVNWKVLPRVRAQHEQRRVDTSARNATRQIEQVVAFLTTLQEAGRHLGETTQHDIDSWFAGHGAIRHVVRPFLSWARQSRQLPQQVELPRAYVGQPVAPMDSEQRWQIARRLVTEDSLDPADRIAAALIVLYAQPLNRVVALTIDDVTITQTGTSLTLGTDALELPEPFATVIRSLPVRRRHGTAENLPTRWLFPGSHAGKHITANALASRLRRSLGIRPRQLRLAASEQLTREIPPAMLSGVLGLHPQTIVRLSAKASGSWANYAADPLST
ncbi:MULTISPECIES: hypothetical protein [Micrococcales]|uniref:hypothetical protein n=1 Tax=Micrococcales TaxID=85006 RepID=UPI0012E13F28|nr:MULTISPECIES: hypothetical protein [Micrococcales]QOT23998.1 hypothetical protein HMI60_20450 [Paenarthrobacter sp. YJN-D]QOT24098.1 hypothetical protein HMI60_20945 [Paenarthrobacter sp. YJN-D]